ncbi:hypothetical protein ACMD2_19018, partial [Ananas comosus]
HVSLPVGTASR